MTLAFVDVGPDRKSWSIETDAFSNSELEREVRRKRALRSRILRFLWNERQDQAAIYAGLQKVGAVKVIGGCKLP